VDFCAGRQNWRENRILSSRPQTPDGEAPGGSIPRIARLMALAIRFEGPLRNQTIRDYAQSGSGHSSAAQQGPQRENLAAPIPITRTQAYKFMYRVMGKNGKPNPVEFHQGNTGICFVIGVGVTLTTGGDIENRKHIPNRFGEDNGPLTKWARVTR
jgi:hypothetical protein